MKESSSTAIAQFGAVRSKLAEMATSCYAGETFTVLLKILKIVSLLVKQKEFSSRSRIKGLKNMLSNVQY
jgi:alkylation response protein AidB-like acyl-CoA dehydrogenase